MRWNVHEDPEQTTPTYCYPELFSIRLHHGGELGHEYYHGGKVDYIDYLDKDLTSLLVIDDMVEGLGYSDMFMNYYYKIPNMDISNVLKPIQGDADVQKMCNFVPKARLLDMYIEELYAEETLTKYE